MTGEDLSSNYILNGEVKRNRIADDIKYRDLKRAGIERLVADPMITSAFIGSVFIAKKTKKYWNKSYLELLSCKAISESFNRDYLLYLDEVAEFVTNSRATRKGIIVAGVVAVIAIITGIIVYTNTRPDKPIENPPVEKEGNEIG